MVLHADLFKRAKTRVQKVESGSDETPASILKDDNWKDSVWTPKLEFTRHRILKIEALLKRMAERVFMLDASIWQVKTYMVRQYFERHSRMLPLGEDWEKRKRKLQIMRQLHDKAKSKDDATSSAKEKAVTVPADTDTITLGWAEAEPYSGAHRQYKPKREIQKQLLHEEPRIFLEGFRDMVISFVVPKMTESVAEYLLNVFPQHLVLTPENAELQQRIQAPKNWIFLDTGDIGVGGILNGLMLNVLILICCVVRVFLQYDVLRHICTIIGR